MSQIKVVDNLTVMQIPRTRKWAKKLEEKFNVTLTISDSGVAKIHGATRADCDRARSAMKKRVIADDFHNALVIANLMDSMPHYEEFTVDPSKLKIFETEADTLKSLEAVLKCVLKVDPAGQVIIFGEKAHCQSFRDSIMKMVSAAGGGDSAADNGATGVAVGGEAMAVGESIDAAMRGDLIDKLDDELKNTDTAVIDKSRPSGAFYATKPFNQSQQAAGRFNRGRGSANQSRTSTPAMFKEKLLVPHNLSGSVVGKEHHRRLKMEQRYECQITVDRQADETGLCMVTFEGNSQEKLLAAKNDIMDFLKCFCHWDGSLAQRRPSPSSDSSEQKGETPWSWGNRNKQSAGNRDMGGDDTSSNE